MIRKIVCNWIFHTFIGIFPMGNWNIKIKDIRQGIMRRSTRSIRKSKRRMYVTWIFIIIYQGIRLVL